MSGTLERLKDYLNSSEGVELRQRYIQHQKFYYEVYLPKWIGKIEQKINQYGEDTVIEYLINKYRNDEYKNREYRCGREPSEPLFYFLLNYAREKCKHSDDDEHWGNFVAEVYYIGSYIIQLNVGQGSFASFKKIK
jgi:hypothetical protein